MRLDTLSQWSDRLAKKKKQKKNKGACQQKQYDMYQPSHLCLSSIVSGRKGRGLLQAFCVPIKLTNPKSLLQLSFPGSTTDHRFFHKICSLADSHDTTAPGLSPIFSQSTSTFPSLPILSSLNLFFNWLLYNVVSESLDLSPLPPLHSFLKMFRLVPGF